MATFTALPHYEAAELIALSEQQLLDLMIKDEDRVPRNVIDECVRRGDAMVATLRALMAHDVDWQIDYHHDGKLWLRLHAVMILGLMDTQAAGEALTDFMQRIEREDFDETEDWLAGYWQALFRNKPVANIERLPALAEDQTYAIFVRDGAVEAYLGWLYAHDQPVFENALGWLAKLIENEQDDWDFRRLCAAQLVDFPRPQFRTLLEGIVPKQISGDVLFSQDEIDHAYDQLRDEPNWARFSDPWDFYSPQEIEQRQARWEEEAKNRDEAWMNAPDFMGDYEFVETYVRDAPKIGRNDPCPCGSGKKFKKCCLGKEAV